MRALPFNPPFQPRPPPSSFSGSSDPPPPPRANLFFYLPFARCALTGTLVVPLVGHIGIYNTFPATGLPTFAGTLGEAVGMLCILQLWMILCLCFREKRTYCVAHRARIVLMFLLILPWIFHVFSRWQGHGDLRGKHTTTEASTPSSSPMVFVVAHTPRQGRAVGRGRRRTRTLWCGRSDRRA